MRTRGYGSYRGRSPWKTFLKILVAIVLVLVVLGVVAAIYLQQFLEVSADGVRLDLPFLQQEEHVVDPEPAPISTPEPPVVEEPTPDLKPEIQALNPVLMGEDALRDGTVWSQVEAADGDCALFDMKNDNGALAYVSEIELAQRARQTAADANLNTAIMTMNETEGVYTIARVSCFKDHEITNYERSLAIITNSGERWLDVNKNRWISPADPAVRDYLTSICVELAQLGFDEILLDNAGYPEKGKVQYIKKSDAYDQANFSNVIGGFYAQVGEALSEYDVKLSVVTTAQAMSGQDTLTGQTPENLAQFARCWMIDEAGVLIPESAISEAD